ncbi:MAG: methylated-DNA--[protein]-cysteine S-methyltransferase [Anaerolineaceae bacterium]|nr:methylated-DNA--[protein]-cysteine S-methyltransferase [Anaerolineaceae bacterium]
MTDLPPVWLAKTHFADFGWICLAVTSSGLWRLSMLADPSGFEEEYGPRQGPDNAPAAQLAWEATRQIDAYLTGQRRRFDLPVDWGEMRNFQRRVLEVTAGIPFGQTLTYAAVARRIGQPDATRAVGAALGANPVAIVIPCHRVVGSDRTLHGFGAPGGVKTKAWLLSMEGHAFSGGRILLDQQTLW